MLKKKYINYDWYFKEKFEENDLKLHNLDNFIKVDIPHTNKEIPLNNFDQTITQTIGIYKKIINVKSLDNLIFVIFEGVGHYAKLYVNSKYASEHKCGYTRFETDITKYLSLGDNEIAVVVDSRESLNQPPFGFVIDYLCYGGIYRDVYLVERSKTYFTDYYFHYDKELFYFDYQVSNVCGNISLKLYDNDKLILSNKAKCGDFLKGKLKNIVLWDIDNPKLYNLVVEIKEGNHLLDKVEEAVGFRYTDFTKDGFYLNGKLLKIRGLNRHQSYPFVGYAMPKRQQESDAEMIRNILSCNAVRTSHYPQSPDFLKRCDEIGLLVFEEIPGWQHIGDDAWKAQAIKNTEDMIKRDRHHPSIILWGVRINESQDDHDFYVKTNEVAHKLDPYRKTGGVRCIQNSEFLEDVYTYNDFMCSNKIPTIHNKFDVTNRDNPYLITEYSGHMYPTKQFDNELRKTEVASIHERVIDKVNKTLGIAGSFGWCFADYNTHKDFGSGDMICYHGVTDIFRNIKYSSYPYMSFRKEPFLAVSSSLNIGDYNGGYLRVVGIFTNCERVEVYHNNELILTFVTNKEDISSRCFILSDFLGNVLVNDEGKSEKEAIEIKELLQKLLDLDGLIDDELLVKYGKEKINEVWKYYGKYIANWGSHPMPYTFIGYNDNTEVIRIIKGPEYLKEFKITTDTDVLHTENSYDVLKLTIETISNLDNRMNYAFDSFNIDVSKNLEVIGDNPVSLIGGVRSIYIRSRAHSGIGKIKISSKRMVNKELTIKIMK